MQDRISVQKMPRLEHAKISAKQELATGNVKVSTFEEFVNTFNKVQKDLRSQF